jgi:ketosteroid isomerase-like protein
MLSGLSRQFVEDFRKVYAARDIVKIASYLHNNVEWTISGPIEYLGFCGTHRGKDAVVDLLKHRIPAVLRTFRFESESVVVDGNHVAMLHRQSARRTIDGRVANYRVANFMQFESGKLIKNLSLLDTFDAVEQLLGHRIQVGNCSSESSEHADVVAV